MKGKMLLNFLLLIPFFLCQQLAAQGGGPPMLTDDPGTPGGGNWEINTSIDLQYADQLDFNIPLLDINYGWKERAQLKFELPFQVIRTKDKIIKSAPGSPLFGIKFRFTDEDTHFLSFSTYPQVSIAINKADANEYKLPIELQKTIGYFTLGEEIGYIHIDEEPDVLLNGNLVGINLTKRWECIAELYIEKKLAGNKTADGFANLGTRFHFSDRIALLASLGTQVFTSHSEPKETLFSFIGFQWLF